jgi:hypothetical protein
MHNIKLYFIHQVGYDKNHYISVINDTVHLTFRYKETCLYTKQELTRVKMALNKERLSYKIEEATSINIAPTNFKLNERTIWNLKL